MTPVEGLTCPRCGGQKIQKEVWRASDSYGYREPYKTMEKWCMNCIKKLQCDDCGLNWEAKTKEEIQA